MARPVVRNEVNGAWIDVFCKGGWKMRLEDGSYITLTAANTKFRNENNDGWIEFYCPLPPPKTVTGGSIRSNRLVDSNGYLWCTGFGIGIYEDGTTLSKTWQKVKYKADGEYIKDVKIMESGNEETPGSPPTYFITRQNKLYVSGNNDAGELANGTYTTGTTGSIVDATADWERQIGSLANIAQLDANGCLIMKDGVARVVGLANHLYTPGSNLQNARHLYGITGAPYGSQWRSDAVGNRWGYITNWTRLQYTTDRTNVTPLNGVISMAKTWEGYTFALRSDGKLFQCQMWYAEGNKYTFPPNGNMPAPKNRYDAMIENGIPFTDSTPVFIHEGAIMEAENGHLYYPQREWRRDGDYFYDFRWVDLGLDLNTLGSKPKRIVGMVNNVGTGTRATVFILLEDGRLFAAGNNEQGWFGIGTETKSVPLNAPIEINNNVSEFDSDVNSTFVMKKDGTMWATGSNGFYRLGLGPDAAGQIFVWTQCIFTSL